VTTTPTGGTVVLFRPVGTEELKLIEESRFSAFPPRLPEQPIFYPVTTEHYAAKIARDWNTQFGGKEGFVVRFAVAGEYLDRYRRKLAGGQEHEEYWIPAEDLPEFNRNIVGRIEVVARFTEADRLVAQKGKNGFSA
jgi:hypothetical protein